MINAAQTHDLATLMEKIRTAENEAGLFLEGEIVVADEDGADLVDLKFAGTTEDAYVSGVYS